MREEFFRAVKNGGWDEIIKIISNSKQLLTDTLKCREDKVAEELRKVHEEATSILSYNNENALSCVITLAYIGARDEYTLIREMPSGEGFADIVFLPKRYSDKPAIVVELKWNRSSEGAITQIKNKNYVKSVEGYGGEILLVGVNYNKKGKVHQCTIERYRK